MTSQTAITAYIREQVQPGAEAVGGFYRMCVLTGKAVFRTPFQWREFILQCWFIIRVAFLPTMAVSI
ncbi:MAG: ABC transporter permease, partial [Mycobacterium sp.]